LRAELRRPLPPPNRDHAFAAIQELPNWYSTLPLWRLTAPAKGILKPMGVHNVDTPAGRRRRLAAPGRCHNLGMTFAAEFGADSGTRSSLLRSEEHTSELQSRGH